MNKFVKELFDGMFDIKDLGVLIKNSLIMMLLLFLSMLMVATQETIINSNYQTTTEFIVLAYLLIGSYILFGWLTFTKLVRYFAVGAIVIFAGLFLREYNLLAFGAKVIIFGLIVNGLYFIGDIIDKVKTKAKKKTQK